VWNSQRNGSSSFGVQRSGEGKLTVCGIHRGKGGPFTGPGEKRAQLSASGISTVGVGAKEEGRQAAESKTSAGRDEKENFSSFTDDFFSASG